MAKYDYKVTTKKGTVFTRSSDRVYSHAVVYTYMEDGTEKKPEFCSRYDLAVKKQLPSWYKAPMTKDIYPVEVIKDRRK